VADPHPFGQRLLDDTRHVALAWIERLRAMGGAGFARRPADDLLSICQAYVTALGRYLVGRDERLMREAAAKEATGRFQMGVPLDDLVAAYRGLQDLLWEAAGQDGAQGRAVEAGLWDLSGAIALSIEETVKAYQKLLTRQIAAHQGTVDELSRQLQQSASVDHLTGLFSARVLYEYLPREIRRAERYRRPVSLVIFDVDDFSRLVNLNGTAEGDRALAELAQVIPGRVRGVDIMCRLDVDEFAVILPETPVLHAVSVAERIRAAAEEHGPFAPDARISGAVRVSAGIAGFPDDASTAEELVTLAREACQHAKRLGKNQVIAFSETTAS
jgi:diguanylate cyclase (GGDEF)-like protein